MGDGSSIASSIAGLDLPALGKAASLLVLPFAHEDLAIVVGAYIVVNDLLPVGLVAAAIYGGMVASDFALYGIGFGARHLPWLSRYAVDARVRRFSDLIRRNLFGLVALCRVVPGIVFVAFVACGWARVSLTRFTIASLVVSAVYLPLILYLVIVFGDALTTRAGLWTWPLLLVALAMTGIVRKRVFVFREMVDADRTDDAIDLGAQGHDGMPALGRMAGKVAAAERIPPNLFYLPLILSWFWFGFRYRCVTLPSTANPTIPTGGMWGEAKSDYFVDVAPDQRPWIADFTLFERVAGNAMSEETTRARCLLEQAGITFPIVAKPDIGWHGYGVQRTDDLDELAEYIASFPPGVKLVLQRFVPYAGEAAVLYARMPGTSAGRILSLTFRYFPHVVGDGRSDLRTLIERNPRARWKAHLHLGSDPTHRGLSAEALARVPADGEVVQIALIGNQRAGGLYRDARRFITPALDVRFDAIARSMREFHYGRFDIRFESVAALARGESFSIVEINGIGGEAIDVWDPELPVREVYRRLIEQQRLLFAIGDRNRARGFVPMPFGQFVGMLSRQTALIRRYPASS